FATQEPAGPSIGLLIAGALVGLWFVIRQLRATQPLLDVRLFANRTVSGALAVFLLSAAALGGVYSLFTQYLQQVQGLSHAGRAVNPARRGSPHRRLDPLADARPKVPAGQRDRRRTTHPGRRLHPVHPARRRHRPRDRKSVV